MNRIESIFASSRQSGRKLLMPFVCGGSPTLDDMRQTLPALAEAGASIIEVGIPFSDPIADGPVIAEAMHKALESGVTPRSVIETIAEIRPTLSAGLVAMTSVSIVERMGRDRFVGLLADAGFDGIIFPDAPLEEAAPLVQATTARGLTASLLVAPTTPIDRARLVCEQCTGFVYVLARAGITGDQGGAPSHAIRERIAALRQVTDLPLAVGFGIGSAEHVSTVVSPNAGDADAAIVGTALVRRMEEAGPGHATQAAAAFCRELATGLV
jgi:tryptophan synthase alpha chain